MSIPDLILNTDKTTTDINNDKITIRQSERGLVLNVTIKSKDGTNYDLSGKHVQFSDNKDGQKLVIDENVQVDSSQKGVIHYTLNKNVYGASGTAWFEIISADNSVIDTTQNFYIEVVRDAEINVANDNYISSLNGLITHVKVAGDKATETINNLATKLTNDINAKQHDVDNATANMTKQFDDKIASLNATLSDYQNKYNKLSSDWTNELNTISNKANSDINAKYSQKITELQNDYNAWKAKEVSDFNATVDPIRKSIQQNATDVGNVRTQVQDAVTKMQQLQQSFDKIDFTKFVTGDQIKNYYTKAETDNLIKTAGKTKTVNGIAPDGNGNIDVPIIKHYNSPQEAYNASKDNHIIAVYDMNDGPSQAVIGDKTVTISTLNDAITSLQNQVGSISSSLSDKGTKADITGLQNQINTGNNTMNEIKNQINSLTTSKAFNDLKNTVNSLSGTVNGLNSNKANQSDLNNLSGRVSNLENKEVWHKCNTEADADAYRKAHPDVPIISWGG